MKQPKHPRRTPRAPQANDTSLMKNTTKRTIFSIFVELARELRGEQMKQAYIRDMAEQAKARGCGTELTEEEYQYCLKEVREVLPAFMEYLRQNRL